MAEAQANLFSKAMAWLTRAEHRAKARAMRDEVARAFTEHPEATGETYLEHLWFTTKMSARLFYAMVVLLIHGLFPFLLLRAASNQIERIYSIIKTRIPKARRDEIDIDYSV